MLFSPSLLPNTVGTHEDSSLFPPNLNGLLLHSLKLGLCRAYRVDSCGCIELSLSFAEGARGALNTTCEAKKIFYH